MIDKKTIEAMKIARKKHSIREIAKMFNCHHSTVLYHTNIAYRHRKLNQSRKKVVNSFKYKKKILQGVIDEFLPLLK